MPVSVREVEAMEPVVFFQSILLCLTFNLENLGGWDEGGTVVWGQMAPQNICTVINSTKLKLPSNFNCSFLFFCYAENEMIT